MNITIVTRNFYPFVRPSGVTSLIKEILGEMRRRETKVSVLSLRKSGEAEYYDYKGIPIHKYNERNPFSYKMALRKAKPDRVIFISSLSGGKQFLVWWSYLKFITGKIPASLYQVTNFSYIKRSYFLKELLSSFHQVFSASIKIKSDLKETGDTETKPLLPGIDVNNIKKHRRNRSFEKGSVISFFGHVAYTKGADIFVSLAKALPEYRFQLIVGKSKDPKDKKLEGILQKEAKELKNLEIKGFMENPLEIMGKSSVMILPYRDGGSVLGVAQSAIEAMGMGIPVIGTNNSALNSLIEDKKNGLYANSKEELIQSIKLLEKDKSLYNQLSRGAIETVEKKFDIKNLVDILLK